MSDCPGRFKCHGPASWCEKCGDVDLICDDPKCDAHSRGVERENRYVTIYAEWSALRAELASKENELAEASEAWARWRLGNPVMVARLS